VVKRLVIVITVLASLVGVAIAVKLFGQEAQTLGVGRIESIGAEVLILDATEITRRGSPRVVVVRLEGPAELVPYHYADEAFSAPQPIESWAEKLGAPVLFNAGQFDENFAHLGWLKRDGRFLTDKRKEQWKALLLSGPVDGGVWARVLDLEQADAAVEKRYRHAVQSMMLVDDQGQVRVRETDKAACRTVVAEDRAGRILIMVTQGAVSLADLARWIVEQRLGIVRAMNMDGGIESQLAVRTAELSLTLYGQYGTGTTVFEGGPGTLRYPIPAVVAVRPTARPAPAP
jgi:hypothetical protein